MRKHIKNSLQGSITVFLSLILLIIISLVMTVIEGARQTTAKAFAERALYTSMDSVLAGFYGPLMEEYHLLGLDCSQEDLGYDDIAESMEDYMSYTFNPSQGLYGAGHRLNLYSNSIESLDVISSTSLMDHRGEVFIHEVIEYMKYRTVGDAAEFLLDKAALLEQPKKVSVLYEEKAKLEKKLVTIDEGILTLMRYIDGLSTGPKGINRLKGGSLKSEDCFVKKILCASPTMDSTEINNERVFLALKNEYRDPSKEFNIIDSSFIRLNELLMAIEALEVSLEHIHKSIEDENTDLKQLEETLVDKQEDEEANIESIEKSIHDVEERISELGDEADALREDIEAYRMEQMNCINTITSNGNSLYELVSGSLTASDQAIIELEQIIKTAKDAEPLINSYEKSLESKKEGLGTEVYDSLEEGLKELKRYNINNSYGYDFLRMKEILTDNYNILVSSLDDLDKGYEAMVGEDYNKANSAYRSASQRLIAYKTNGLKIDYSTLVVEDDDSPDYLGSMKELVEEGITSLVIDTNTISDNKITGELLPSIIDLQSVEEEGFSFSNLLKNMKIGGKESGTEDLFGSFGDFNLGAFIGDGANKIIEGLLVQGYINDHFYRFPVKNEEKDGRKPSALTYEREYLLYGNSADKDNLQAVIRRLILVRTLLNFTSILGEKEKWNEAKSIATKLVGFTGLPILVAITQGVLMILLALASALVDTCALLMGKEIPILKKKVDERYSDLLILTRENIRKKATSYKDNKGFSYNDYLTLFLFLTNQRKLSYRMMDLIQENINMRYGKEFSIQNCLFGFETEASFHIKPLFTSFSFVNKYINNNNDKFLIIRAECSY